MSSPFAEVVAKINAPVCIGMNELDATWRAAKLLRRHGLISVENIWSIRERVHRDAVEQMELFAHIPDAAQRCYDIAHETRPL